MKSRLPLTPWMELDVGFSRAGNRGKYLIRENELPLEISKYEHLEMVAWKYQNDSIPAQAGQLSSY